MKVGKHCSNINKGMKAATINKINAANLLADNNIAGTKIIMDQNEERGLKKGFFALP